MIDRWKGESDRDQGKKGYITPSHSWSTGPFGPSRPYIYLPGATVTVGVTTFDRVRRVFIGGFAALLAAAVAGCNPDPTSGGFTFKIVNDRSFPVVVKYCDNRSCTRVDWKATVPVGETEPANSSAEGHDEWYQFVDADSSALLGCATVRFHQRKTGIVLRVSSARPCAS